MRYNVKYKKIHPGIIALAMAFMLLPGVKAMAHAKEDSMAVFKQFVQVCVGYNQLPMHVNMLVQNTADIVTTPQQDSTAYNVDFFLLDKGLYIKAGEDEQLINDSVIVSISRRLKRMAVRPNKTHSVAEQMKLVMGRFSQDSSLEKLSAKFTVVLAPGLAGETNSIRLVSKAVLPGSQLPKQRMEAVYKKDTKLPVSVEYVRTKLVAIDSTAYAQLLKDPGYNSKLVATGNGYFFLIKSAFTRYVFNAIDYSNVSLPLQVSDCIRKNASGHFVPAPGYELFKISENF